MGVEQEARHEDWKYTREFCEQNGIPFMVPFTARSGLGLMYTASTHTLTQVPAVEAMVSTYQ